MKFCTMASDALCNQVAQERLSDANPDRRDERGIIIRPDKLLKGLCRADQILDEVCTQAIEDECSHLRRQELKNSYVVKGHGKGKGT